MTAWSRKGRTSEAYICRGCGSEFHPLYTSKRLYCSPKCNGRALKQRATKINQARAAAIAGEMTDADIAEFIRSLPPLPPLLEDDAPEQADDDAEDDDLWAF